MDNNNYFVEKFLFVCASADDVVVVLMMIAQRKYEIAYRLHHRWMRMRRRQLGWSL